MFKYIVSGFLLWNFASAFNPVPLPSDSIQAYLSMYDGAFLSATYRMDNTSDTIVDKEMFSFRSTRKLMDITVDQQRLPTMTASLCKLLMVKYHLQVYENSNPFEKDLNKWKYVTSESLPAYGTYYLTQSIGCKLGGPTFNLGNIEFLMSSFDRPYKLFILTQYLNLPGKEPTSKSINKMLQIYWY